MRVDLIGCGLLGTDICLYFISKKIKIKIYCYNHQNLTQSKERIDNRIQYLKETLQIRFPDNIFDYVSFSEELENIEDAELIIESISEDLHLKRELFQKIEKVTKGRAIILTNTSSLNIYDLSKGLEHRENLIGANWWNPAFLMPLVELVKTNYVSEKTIEKVVLFLEEIEKKPIVLKRPISGHVGNRLQFALFREAIFLVNNNIASYEDIDNIVKYGLGLRLSVMGPFETAYCGGLETFKAISNNLFPELSSEIHINEPMFSIMDNKLLYENSKKDAIEKKRDKFLRKINYQKG